jgi:hypothetical protein
MLKIKSDGISVRVNAEQTLEATLEYSDIALYAARPMGETAPSAPITLSRKADLQTCSAWREFWAAAPPNRGFSDAG